MESHLSDFLFSLVYFLPMLFIYFIGFVLSFVFRKRVGKVWLVPVFAFLLLIFTNLLGIGMQAFYHFYVISAAKFEYYTIVARVYSFVSIGLEIIAYALLMIALFAKRDSASTAGS